MGWGFSEKILAAKLLIVNAAIALKANIASPTFTGTPAAPTATAGTNTTQLATTAFVQAELVSKGIPTWVAAPAAANSTGVAGQMAADTGYIYRCTATDTWKRVAIATWP